MIPLRHSSLHQLDLRVMRINLVYRYKRSLVYTFNNHNFHPFFGFTKLMIVKDIMSKSVIYTRPDTPLQDAVVLMARSGVSCLVVCEQDHHDQLMGIFTERDLTRCVANSPNCLSAPIAEVMTEEPTYLPEDTSLWEALKLVNSRGIKHFPIKDPKGNVVGLVTQTDIVQMALKMAIEFEQLKGVVKELSLLCSEDALLKIPNRRAMEEELQFLASFSKRHNTPYSVCLLDVDYFKNYNDHYGHQSGDEALQLISQTIMKFKRDSDRLFRYGGEEFLITMQGTSLHQAKIGAERILKSISDLNHTHESSPLGYLTISIGIAEANTQKNPERVVKLADEALYKAKENGRNQVWLYGH